MNHGSPLSRRRFVLNSVAVAGAWPLQRAARAAALAPKGPACKLTPEQEQGPYYLPDAPLRLSLAEDREGVPLSLRMQVMDVHTCQPLANAAIDMWHCDAEGEYSAGQRTFLRGIQVTDNYGIVAFRTLFPGVEAGRTNHLHYKVRLGGQAAPHGNGQTWAGGRVVHTGQIFFPEDVALAVAKGKPYSQHAAGRTTQAQDKVFAEQHGADSMANVLWNKQTEAAFGLRAELTVAVAPSATRG